MWPDYPSPTPTTVSVGGLSDRFEGAGRPGHFDGVASVVAKLFAITGPSRPTSVRRTSNNSRSYARWFVISTLTSRSWAVRSCATTTVWRSPVEMRDSPSTGDAGPLALGGVGASRATRRLRQRTALDPHVNHARGRGRGRLAEIVDPSTLVPSRDDETGERRRWWPGSSRAFDSSITVR